MPTWKIKLGSHAQEMMKAFVYGNTVGGHEFVGLQRVSHIKAN